MKNKNQDALDVVFVCKHVVLIHMLSKIRNRPSTEEVWDRYLDIFQVWKKLNREVKQLSASL